MFSLTRPFVDLCFLRIGPQNLPASGLLLAIALVAHLLAEWIGFSVLMPGENAFLAALAATVILAFLTFSILAAQRRQSRLLQTLTAMAGAITVIDLIGIPLATWWRSVDDGSGAVQLPLLLLLVLTVWSVAIQGHILRHALSIPLAMGVMIAMFFFWFSFQVMHYLFPGSGS